MTTGLYPDILTILCTNLTQLEGGPHLTIQLVLLLSNLDTTKTGSFHVKKQKKQDYFQFEIFAKIMH